MAQLISNLLPMPPRKIIYIHPNDTVEKCIQLMVEFDVGALVVVDNSRQTVGIVSEKDIVQALYKGKNTHTATAQEIAFKSISVLSPHDGVDAAMVAISRTKRRHVLICEKNQHVAIVSIGDLLYNLLEDKNRVIEQLTNYIYTY